MKRSLTEIAARLGLNLDTLERWIRQGKIPVNKQGGMGIYNVSELNRWAERQRRLNPCHRVDASSCESDASLDKDGGGDAPEWVLLAALKRGGVFHGIRGEDKEAILRAVVERVPDFPGKDSEAIFGQLMEREQLTSTGIGKGVAIPHPRNPVGQELEAPMIVTCFTERPVPFQSIDDLPVFVLFLMLSPTVDVHLNLLSRLSFCLRDDAFVGLLQPPPDAATFYQRIKEMEVNLEG